MIRRKLGILAPIIVRSPLLLFEIPAGIFVVLLIRLLRPVCLVRLQRLIGWRIGHFAGNIEIYLCELDAGINRPSGRFLDVWYHLSAPCNEQLDAMWRRVIHIGPSRLLRLVDRMNGMIPGVEAYRIGDNSAFDLDVHNLLDRYPAHLGFTAEEEIRGQAGLRALGIPEGAQFVILIVRDAAYLNTQSHHLDWSRHDYRDCDIKRYAMAALQLAERGFYVVRMGAVVAEPFQVNHPMVIDYATNGLRNDFMDIYLAAKCTFCICGNSGFEAVPYVFRRPMVYVDMVPLGLMRTDSRRLISTTKKHWLRHEKRFMSFREILTTDAAYATSSDVYKALGVELIESEPEEIAALVMEMGERIRGVWEATQEDDALQRRFWELFPESRYHGEIRSLMGADFLRRHAQWLD